MPKKKEGNRAQKEHGVWESSGIDQIKKIKEDIGLKKKQEEGDMRNVQSLFLLY